MYFDKIKITEGETLDKVCSLLYSNIGEGDYDNKNDILDDENFRVNFAKFVVLFSFLFNSTHSVPKPPDEKRKCNPYNNLVNTINSGNCVAGKSGSSSQNRAHHLKKHFNLKIHYVIERVDRRIGTLT